ncbi:hypothetical protein LWI28_027129 [Acer negundo]|uniref:Protein kinase domain-containing protein n=1 Tax=Acer negundo TaxID=4023 RepID=A0AAD5IKQ4_ACENE|nr:hypothetical protein LWI28_027129 [Acer negundo]
MGQREHLELLLANMMKCTDFGYAKDFDRRYTIGKLLRHGQFGYTYVATDKANGDHVAVKKIEKIKKGKSNSVVGLGKLGRVMLLAEIMEITPKMLMVELKVVGGGGDG